MKILINYSNFLRQWLLRMSFTFGCLMVLHSLNAQSISVNCSSGVITVTSEPPITDNIIFSFGYKIDRNNPCRLFSIEARTEYAIARHFLEKKQSNGSWTIIEGPIFGYYPSFNTTGNGAYRIRFQKPRRTFRRGCPEDAIEVLNLYDPSFVGWRGEYAANPDIDASFSNEVIIGGTTQNDIAWSFIDPNNNNLFNPGDIIKMNTTGTKNYTDWWVAIFENGGQNRYWTNGWTNGQIPGNQINLSDYNAFPGGFQQIPVSYTVQFAISSSCNTQWINLDRNFSVCPPGFGCRVAKEEKIVVSPNPTGSSFQLVNLDLATLGRMRVVLSDISGRLVKDFAQINQPDFDVSDLSNGLYIVGVWKDGNRIQTTKLSIVK